MLTISTKITDALFYIVFNSAWLYCKMSDGLSFQQNDNFEVLALMLELWLSWSLFGVLH